MKIIKNSKGVALAQALIVAGLVGGMSMGVMHLVKTVNHAKEQVAAIATIDKIVSDIKKVLTDEKNCMVTFAGVNSNGGVFTNIRSTSGTTLYTVDSSKIFEMSRVNLVGFSTSTSGVGADAFNLNIMFEKADRVVTKKIKIFTFPNNTVAAASRTNCFAEKEVVSESSRVKLCEELGGTIANSSGQCSGVHRPVLEFTRDKICKDQGGVWDSAQSGCITPNQTICTYGVKGFDGSGNTICCGNVPCTIP